jgi:outer membrane protein TolC
MGLMHRLRNSTPLLLLFLGLLQLGGPPSGQAAEAVAQLQVDPAHLVQELSSLEAQIEQRATPVSLEQAVAQGIRANPQLQQAFAAIQQYEWQLIAAQRQWYPTLQLTNGTPFAGVQWQSFSQNYSFTSPTAPPNFSNNSQLFVFQPGVSINWNMIDPTRQPNINAAVESLRQQKLLFDVSARNLILDLQQSYYAIQASRQLIDSFRRIYAINQQQLTMLEAQRSIGLTTVLDVEATRSQLFAQLNQLVGYIRSYIDQAASLAAAMALPEDQLAIPSEPATLRGAWEPSLEQTIQQARRQREEILASLAAAESARWNGVAAIRSYLPVFGLVANGSLITNQGPERTQNGGFNTNVDTTLTNGTAAIGIGFNWMLFDGGIQAANAQAAKAQALQQKAQSASTDLQVIQQVRSSFGRLATARVAYISAQQAYRSAELGQEAARARFAVGVGDITSVVQTIQQLSEATEQLAAATLSYNTALARLYRYSATWPDQTHPEVHQRLQQLRGAPAASARP